MSQRVRRSESPWLPALSSVVNTVLILGLVYYVVFAGLQDGFRLEHGSVSSQVQDVLWFSLLCGAASAATIEIAKRLTSIRGRYQERTTINWLEARGLQDPDLLGEALTRHGRRADVLRTFNLPSEQLAGQIAAVLETAVLAPSSDSTYEPLLTAFAGAPRPEVTSPDDTKEVEFLQALRTGVDQLQITLRDSWRRYVQGAAIWISGLCGLGLVYTPHFTPAERARDVLAALVLGGTIAWILRDLTAFVERARS